MRHFALLFALALAFGAHAQASDPQVSFSDDLAVGGTVTAGEGIVFPDGTVQTTAAPGAADSSLTANGGLYSNRIIEFAPPLPYVEVCFKNGGVAFDIHTGNSESTTGGNCEPGDKGWVIERDVRAVAYWEDARAECLMNDMRLPEPFEYQFCCRRAQALALAGMPENVEWTSNFATPARDAATNGVGIVAFGGVSCSRGGWGWVGNNNNVAGEFYFRCVR